MVYYYTSKNINVLKNIINDYEAFKEISPSEYMQKYIEKCPETMENATISWIVETFLRIEKHDSFLKELKTILLKELTKDDQDYFIVILDAVIFQVTPKYVSNLYKCLFNLSKPLLKSITTLLSNGEVLAFISRVAQKDYDTNFISEKINAPLYLWQPYLKEMLDDYNKYVTKMFNKKIKLPTKPVTPKVLNRKIKTSFIHSIKKSSPTPPNSICKETKMLTKSVIDQKLKQLHDINKEKAMRLLNAVKSKNNHYAVQKSENYYKKLTKIQEEIKNEYENGSSKYIKPKIDTCSTAPAVKETATTLRRINKRIQLSEKEELQWLEDLIINCRNTTKIEELEEHDRQEKERERLLDIERKHLLGKISYEDALIAKKKLYDENKKKYDNFLKEKRSWEEQIEIWKKNEMSKNRKQVEKLSLIELDMLHAKNLNIAKKKEVANQLKRESEKILSEAEQKKQEELDQKIKMIRELKILAMIAKKVKIPKIIDLTESSGLGLLCEMSIAELQEKLNITKIELKEELDKKRKNIQEQKQNTKNDLEETKKAIDNYMTERRNSRKEKKKPNVTDMPSSSKSSNEINKLKKILEEKRNLRMKLMY